MSRTERSEIPGTSEYIRVPLKDTVKLSEGTMSAAVRLHHEYAVLNGAGEKIRTISGTDLMKQYDDRTLRMRGGITKNNDRK